MNIKKQLIHISNILIRDRATGQTAMMAKAAEETGGMVITVNFDQAKYIETTYNVPAKSVYLNFDGFNGPFFLDHYANSVLLVKASNKIENLEKQIDLLTEALTYREGSDHQLRLIRKQKHLAEDES